jgi:hypothetical protein
MKESHSEEVANHTGSESCGENREGLAEAIRMPSATSPEGLGWSFYIFLANNRIQRRQARMKIARQGTAG